MEKYESVYESCIHCVQIEKYVSVDGRMRETNCRTFSIPIEHFTFER